MGDYRKQTLSAISRSLLWSRNDMFGGINPFIPRVYTLFAVAETVALVQRCVFSVRLL